MTESAKKKVPNQIVVSLDVKRAIEDEATRLTRIEGQRVTQGDVVARAWEALKSTAENVSGRRQEGNPNQPRITLEALTRRVENTEKAVRKNRRNAETGAQRDGSGAA